MENYRPPNDDPYTDPYHGMTWNDKYIIMGGGQITIGIFMVGGAPFTGPLGPATYFAGSWMINNGVTRIIDQIQKPSWAHVGDYQWMK